MTYSVKEMFYTLQGEGAMVGRPAIFIRLSGCNLWTGREKDRATAHCQFCDTEFVGTDGENGGKYDNADTLAAKAKSLWPLDAGHPFAVITGGEPLLQVDQDFIKGLHGQDFTLAIETNGTLLPPEGPRSLDWICVSPKLDADGNHLTKLTKGDELKLVYPQHGGNPHQFEGWDFKHFYLQPMDGPDLEANTKAAIDYCKAHPKWRLSIQTHKILDIP
jgi:7-carboxy-7-deazaguanine synthase (Cx14CxxC type)